MLHYVCTAPLQCHFGVASCNCDIVISLYYFVLFLSVPCVEYHLPVKLSGGHYDHPDMCESVLFFLRVVSKNVPIFRPDDGNVAESLSLFNSTFSIKNNTIWHVNDHFYTHNLIGMVTFTDG